MNESIFESEKGNRHYQLLKEFDDGVWKNIPDIQKKIHMNGKKMREIIQTFTNKELIQTLRELSDKEQKQIINHINREIRSNENYYRITKKGKSKLLKFDEACIDSDSREIFNFGLKWK